MNKNKNVGEVSEGEWSVDEEDQKEQDKEKAKKKQLKDKKVLGKRKRPEGDEENDMKDFFNNNEFEVVPQ